jgi:hypothetical protein
MPMMAMPARVASVPDQASSSAPIALALAPNATNTVEKPSTNSPAAATVSRLTRGSDSPSARCSSDVPVR